MSENIGELSRRSILRLSAITGAGLLLGACDVGGGGQGDTDSGGQGSGEGKINALFMKQAGYSEDDIRAMTAEFQKAYPKIRSNLPSSRTRRCTTRLWQRRRPARSTWY